ncbi:potassium-transporting ATPase subunit C [Actinoplanes sp. L3-i22]|uniref:potassium-transporting ATPase subunit C n=1 Tax=Actinoplanes sp. L3-i22 TaxID=2836373 RepID=UPI001C75582E|nr:potassium-transporting ATPase subunit C [Actinoplanes sp. L3-i22]BCY06895.1 potassium-transporting ATPase KdpC subunit [Actinoplanes sp. L3-i22]
MRLPAWLAQHLAALRALLVFTVLLGLAYPLLFVGLGKIPGLGEDRTLIGQSFTDADGNPVPKYFQSRPSAAGDGYDPTSTGASNLGPEDVVDTQDRKSLLTRVCERSLAVGKLEGMDGSRPYCTADGVGAVLAVFYRDGFTGPVTRVVSVNQTGVPFVSTYRGVGVESAKIGEDYVALGGVITPIRGDAPVDPVVPADAVTASGSGLDPDISGQYADLQAARVARERGVTLDRVHQLIRENTSSGVVNVLKLNTALDGVNHPTTPKTD